MQDDREMRALERARAMGRGNRINFNIIPRDYINNAANRVPEAAPDPIEPVPEQHMSEEEEEEEDAEDPASPANPANPPNPANAGDLFQQPETVLDIPTLKIVVQRKMFERQKRFKYDDLLFNVKVIPKRWRRKKVKPPLLLDSLENIFRALVKIIDRLKLYYANDDHRQLYLTVIERGINHGLNGGNFSIREHSEVIAISTIDQIYYYAQVC